MSGRHWTSWLAHALTVVCLAFLGVVVVVSDGRQAWGNVSIDLFVLITLFAGWLLAWRRPRTALGWMVLAIPLLFSVLTPLIVLGRTLIPTHPTAAAWLLLVGGGNGDSNMSWVPPIGLLLSQVPLRFPNGLLPSRRWRWFFWYTVVAIVAVTVLGDTLPDSVGYGVANPAHVGWGGAGPVLTITIFVLGLAVSFVGSVASLFVRYRHAGTVERAQLRWVFWGAAVAIGLLLLSWASLFIGEDSQFRWVNSVAEGAVGLGYCLIPVAVLVAVMRFGLYGIDRIISRTVSYTTVVVAVVALYVGIVTGLTAVIPHLPSIGVALATLVAAAVFLPLLRRVQRRIDRRFNRAAYDAQKVVEAFGQRLRTGADPHGAVAELAAAVDQALQPVTLGVWTRGTT